MSRGNGAIVLERDQRVICSQCGPLPTDPLRPVVAAMLADCHLRSHYASHPYVTTQEISQ